MVAHAATINSSKLSTRLFLPSAVAAQQATLLELLDAPQLMDTCVRNGIYDEALDLHAFIMRVALLHPDLPIVKLLAAQVWGATVMLQCCSSCSFVHDALALLWLRVANAIRLM
jgi:hypothetical protein